MRQRLSLGTMITVCLVLTGSHARAGEWLHEYLHEHWQSLPYELCPCPGLCAGLPYDDQEKAIIAMSRPMPPGWLIVGTRHSVNCNGLGNNAWIIQKIPTIPAAEMLIYSNQPIPPGWAIVRSERTIYSPTHEMLRIRRMN